LSGRKRICLSSLAISLQDEALSTDAVSTEAEVIRERYANRAVKVEREVIRDASDNYVNHGSWRMWDQEGNMIAKGQYDQGNRGGSWTAWYAKTDNKTFQQAPYKEFVGPFTSNANFRGGELDGSWTVYDGKKRKIIEFSYANGVRHGVCSKYYSNGRKMDQVEYKNGELDGVYRQWSADGHMVTDDVYEDGRTIGRKITHYRDRKKKSEGEYLLAMQELAGKDDWWTLTFATTVKNGEDEKHGEWRTWYPNGQAQVEGTYKHDQPSGESSWSWWYPNGQKAVEGSYEAGQQNGTWTWWHQNGQKKLAGNYVVGEPSDKWIWWKQDGQVLQKMDFSAANGDLAVDDLRESADDDDANSGADAPSVLSVPITTELPDLQTIKK
jgi:antitoxin component YwqK of YwqJK toxin-antitoxin module